MQVTFFKVRADVAERRVIAAGTEEERLYVLEMERCLIIMETEVDSARNGLAKLGYQEEQVSG